MKRLCDCLLVEWRSHRISWVLWRFHGNLCLNRIYWEYHGNILPKFCPNQMWRFYNQVPGWWVFPCFFWLDQLKVVFVSPAGLLEPHSSWKPAQGSKSLFLWLQLTSKANQQRPWSNPWPFRLVFPDFDNAYFVKTALIRFLTERFLSRPLSSFAVSVSQVFFAGRNRSSRQANSQKHRYGTHGMASHVGLPKLKMDVLDIEIGR